MTLQGIGVFASMTRVGSAKAPISTKNGLCYVRVSLCMGRQ